MATRMWVHIESCNPYKVINTVWAQTNIVGDKTIYGGIPIINPTNPFEVGKEITKIIIQAYNAASYFSAGSIFRIYGR